jgi:hypothetical protein
MTPSQKTTIATQPGVRRSPIPGAMATEHDILDDFDDDLARSIETAKQGGQWQESSPGFDDPKLKELARKLGEVPVENYNERRLQDMQKRVATMEAAERRPTEFGMELPKATAAAPANAGPAPTKPAADWRENVVQNDRVPDLPPTPAEQAAASLQPAFGYLKTMMLAAPVFIAAALVHGIITGFTPGLALRAALATAMAGCMWRATGAGRFQAAGLAMAAHLLVFFTDVAEGDRSALLAVFLGLLVAMIGGGAMGLVREQRSENGRA